MEILKQLKSIIRGLRFQKKVEWSYNEPDLEYLMWNKPLNIQFCHEKDSKNILIRTISPGRIQPDYYRLVLEYFTIKERDCIIELLRGKISPIL